MKENKTKELTITQVRLLMKINAAEQIILTNLYDMLMEEKEKENE